MRRLRRPTRPRLVATLALVALAASCAAPATTPIEGVSAPGRRGEGRPPRPPRLVPGGAPLPEIPGLEPLELRPERPYRDLSGHFDYLVDETRALTIDDVRSSEWRARFVRSDSPSLNLGFTAAAVWLRFDIVLRGPQRDGWMLEFDYPLLDRVEFYDARSPDDRPAITLGDRQPFWDRVVPHRTFAIPLLQPGQQRTRIYVRVVTESSMQLHPSLLNGRDIFLNSIRDELFFGLAYGVMLLMILHNLFLFFGVRDRTYLAYVASSTFALLFLGSLYGHVFQYLLPDHPALANLGNPLFASLWLTATAAFALFFLEPWRYAPRLSVVLTGLFVVGVASSVVAVLAPYRVGMELASLSAAVGALLLLAAGLVAWKRGRRTARFFTIAWIGTSAGTFFLAMSRFGLFPDNRFTHHGALFGGMFEMFLLSLALSDRYRQMTLELRGYSKGLETAVAERTRQLEAANEELQRLSDTDALTQVANRRLFDEQLEIEVRRHRRSTLPLSLAMVDIDHFKPYNDRFGHQKGDLCLRRVAQEIRRVASRPGDLVARYGGEEFAVILPHTDGSGARQLCEEICELVRALAIPSADPSDLEVVTVSVGFTTAIPEADGDVGRLIALADRALYAAKRAGRDGVRSEGVEEPEERAG